VQSTAQEESFKSVKNGGCLRLNFLLPAIITAESQFLYILNINNSMGKKN
jgi:hypothetical protein